MAWLRDSEIAKIWLQIRVLTEVRIRTAWARMSSSPFRLALSILFLAYCVYLAYSSGATGMAVGMLAVQRPDAVIFLKNVVLVCFAIVLVASVLWGPGLQAGLDERTLRYYPIGSFSRTCILHARTLLSPIWIATALFLLVTLEYVAMVRGGASAAFVSSALLFVWFYQGSIILRYLLRAVVRHTAITIVLIVLSFGVGTITGASFWQVPMQLGVSRMAKELGEILPVAAAVRVAFLGSYRDLLSPFAWVLCEGAVLVYLGKSGQEIDPARTKQGRLGWALFSSFSSPLWIMVGKSVRYHFMCNRVRLGIVLSPAVLCGFVCLIGPRMSPQGKAFGALAASFIMAFLITRPITLNHFGYDAEGLTRYAILPIRYADFLLADSIASLLLGLIIGVAGIGLLFYENTVPWSLSTVLFMLAFSVDGAIFFNALGMITSYYSPRKVSLSKLLGNDMSVGGNIVLYAAFCISFFPAFYIADLVNFASIRMWSWLPLAMLPLFLTFAAAVWKWIAPRVDASKEWLIREMG